MNFIGNIWFRMVPMAFPSPPEDSVYHNTNSHLISTPNMCYFETWMFSFCLWAKQKVEGGFEQVIFSSIQALGDLVSEVKK